MEYIAYLHKEKASDFGVSFPDFPGCVTAGKTLEEARTMAVEALKLHIAGMLEDGETLPEPSTLDRLADDPAMQGAVTLPVSAVPREKGCASTLGRYGNRPDQEENRIVLPKRKKRRT